MTRLPKTLLAVAGTLLAVCVLVTLAAPRTVHDLDHRGQRLSQLVVYGIPCFPTG
jgi:hypothetical protein